jgi:hypothetical protein
MTVLGHLRAAIVLTAVCLAAPAALAQVPPEQYAFGKDALVDLPAGYEEAPGSGEILQVQLKGGGAIRFSLGVRDAGRARNSGEAAVRALAKQKGLQTRRSGKKLVVLEPRTEGQIDGRATRSMRIEIGFGRSVAVMTLTVFEDEKDAHRVQHFFNVEMEEIIASIRRTGG